MGAEDAIPDRGRADSNEPRREQSADHRRHLLVVRGPGRRRAGHFRALRHRPALCRQARSGGQSRRQRHHQHRHRRRAGARAGARRLGGRLRRGGRRRPHPDRQPLVAAAAAGAAERGLCRYFRGRRAGGGAGRQARAARDHRHRRGRHGIAHRGPDRRRATACRSRPAASSSIRRSGPAAGRAGRHARRRPARRARRGPLAAASSRGRCSRCCAWSPMLRAARTALFRGRRRLAAT